MWRKRNFAPCTLNFIKPKLLLEQLSELERSSRRLFCINKVGRFKISAPSAAGNRRPGYYTREYTLYANSYGQQTAVCDARILVSST